MKKDKNNKGFTLVELVITMAVIAILAAVLVPVFSGILNRARKNAQQQEILSVRNELLINTENVYSVSELNNFILVHGEDIFEIVNGEPINCTDSFDKDELGSTYVLQSYQPSSSVQVYVPVVKTKVATLFDFVLDEVKKTATVIGYNGNLTGDVVIPKYIDGLMSTELTYTTYSNKQKLLDDLYLNNIYTKFVLGYSVNGTTFTNYLTFTLETTTPAEIESILNEKLSKYSYFRLGKYVNTYGICNDNYLVTAIADGAFYDFKNITSIKIPNSVTKIGQIFNEDVIDNICTVVNNVYYLSSKSTVLVEGVKEEYTNPYYFMYYYNSNNYNVSFNENTEVVCANTSNYAIESIDIHANIKYIDVGFLESLSNIETITCDTLNSYYQSIDDVMLIEKATKKLVCVANVETIEIPNFVKIIGQNSIANRYNLKNLTIPEGITTIEDTLCCYALTSLNLPTTLTTIENQSYINLPNLTEITVASGNTVYKATDNTLIEMDTNTVVLGSAYSIIPDNIKVIKNNAFQNVTKLSSITIPASVITIENHAFDYCINLETLNFEENSQLTTIGDDAFTSLTKLTSVTLPEGLTSIGSYAFSGCTSLETLHIPSTVSKIGYQAFYDCPLTNFTIDSSNMYFEILSDMLIDKDNKNIIMVVDKTASSYEIPSYVTQIGDYLFSDCTNLQTIIIPQSVTSIGYGSFSGCENLINIWDHYPNYDEETGILETVQNALPSTITVINGYTFNRCYKLESLSLPSSLTKIDSLAFEYCYSLTSLYIPRYVSEIAYDAFDMCYAIEVINVDGENKTYHSENNAIIETATKTLIKGCKTTTISENVLKIGQNAFYGSHISELVLHDNITEIGYYAFAYCYFTEIELPNSLTEIKTGIFLANRSLQTVIIGSGTTKIDPSTFWYTLDNMVIYYAGDDATSILINKTNNTGSILSDTATWYYLSTNEEIDISTLNTVSGTW